MVLVRKRAGLLRNWMSPRLWSLWRITTHILVAQTAQLNALTKFFAASELFIAFANPLNYLDAHPDAYPDAHLHAYA